MEQTPSPKPEANDIPQENQTKKPKDPFARLKTKKVAVPKNIDSVERVKVKQWAKVSPKVFLIGCAITFVMFLGIMFAGLYFAISSSEILQNFGMDIESVKTVLKIFAALFFGLVTMLGLYILVLNVYRLITVKKKSKIRYIAGLFGGILLMMGTIVLWTISFQRINGLWGVQRINTNLLLIPHLETAEWPISLLEGVKIIAPYKLYYQLNKPQFEQNILPAIGGANSRITAINVDCGNEQKLFSNVQVYTGTWDGYFNGTCLYTDKSAYEITLEVQYINRQNGEPQVQIFPVSTITWEAQIELTPDGGEITRNDAWTELVAWVAPILMNIQAQRLFTDLWLPNDRIIWDFDDTLTGDFEDNATFFRPFGDSKLHTVNYRLPELPGFEDTWFTFDIRVLESSLPQCTLSSKPAENNDKRFTFTPQFSELADVASYAYTIYDVANDTFVERNMKETKDTMTYTFQSWGQYEIQTSYFTPEWEKWNCSPYPLTVGFVWNNVDFELKYRETESEPYLWVNETTPVQFNAPTSTISVGMLPAQLQIQVEAIRPDPTSTLKVFYDGRQLFNEWSRLYEVDIMQLWTKELRFEITTPQGVEEEQLYTVEVTRQPVKADIVLSTQVWEDPLEVELDASISPLYDETDEIVFFTWDFGDGQVRRNLSQWTISHTYRYDTETDSGEYYPMVTIQTKNWFTDSYRIPEPILVKKKQRTVEIVVESHPTRQARIWDLVTFTLQTDGVVKSIDRDYGNDKTYGCDWRQCVTTPMRYETAWTYEVAVEVEYENDVAVTGRQKIRVY